MASNGLFAEVAALASDSGRESMLHALMDGRALTATELTKVVGITPQTASGHLNRMIGVGILNVEKQGRHRYYRIATPSVAQASCKWRQPGRTNKFRSLEISPFRELTSL
jgi:DNA-binding transcriptional ArsR family regulator